MWQYRVQRTVFSEEHCVSVECWVQRTVGGGEQYVSVGSRELYVLVLGTENCMETKVWGAATSARHPASSAVNLGIEHHFESMLACVCQIVNIRQLYCMLACVC